MSGSARSMDILPDILAQTVESNVRTMMQSCSDAEQADRIRADVLSIQQAFDSVDRKLPGFIQDFLRGFMERFGLETVLDVEEMTLRLSSMDVEIPHYLSSVPHCQVLEKNAADLKHVLSRIPTEIGHRNEFIALIKQIANAIKNLLDCINLILNALPSGVTKQGLDDHMRKFVDYSRKFSSALKKFFRDRG
ncbi:unnamed protein product [Dibothriocephalus latus]|uniref:Uncharacterized protein n=1 Tax=Dibothriocephalus latus TaxID=60516 RepID=A0A3P6NTI5_DIBLA|nr:unnamed protein product [Dibothriocephalus latus]